jgi:hypothetical protein
MDLIKIIGMTLKEAETFVKEGGYIIRVRSVDGKNFLGTCDYREDRINVEIVNGKINAIRSLG